MNNKKICFIAQFPPPMHGLSKAVETLYNSERPNEFEFEKVDITNNKNFLKNFLLISKSRADLFYFTISQTKGGNLRDLLIIKLLSIQHKKCLVHLHGGYYRKLVDNDLPGWQRKANYKSVGSLAGAIVLGDSLKLMFEGMLVKKNIFIVPNCVDDEYLMSDSDLMEKMRTLKHRSVKHVLYLSNFIKTKGYSEVLGLAKLEKERCEAGSEKKFHFDFAGKFFEKNEEEFFFNYIKENALDDYVTYHGIVGGDKKRELLNACDIFALLTRYPNEGQPISILEAMGNGMIIVTTDHAGIPDIVEDGVNGIVLSKDNVDIIDSYKRISNMSDMQLAQIMHINRSEVMTKYREKQYIANMVEIFKIE